MSDDIDSNSQDARKEKQAPAYPPQAITASATYGALAQLRNTEAQLRWIGFQAAVALNVAGGAGLLLYLRADTKELSLILGFIVCAVGLFFNFIHYKILGRDGKFMELWNQKLVELEQANGVEGGVQIFSSVRYLSLRNRWPTIQEVLRFCVLVCMVLWIAGGTWIVMLLVLGG